MGLMANGPRPLHGECCLCKYVPAICEQTNRLSHLRICLLTHLTFLATLSLPLMSLIYCAHSLASPRPSPP